MEGEKLPTTNAPIKKREKEAMETIVRFSNRGKGHKVDKLKIGPSFRKYCVRDFSCCGQYP